MRYSNHKFLGQSSILPQWNDYPLTDENSFARGCEIGAVRAHANERRLEGGAAWRGATRRVATLGAAASLSQPCAVRATTTREEEAPPLLAVARADATRRRAPVRPSRALVRVRTSTETRDPRPPGVVCAASLLFLLSLKLVLKERPILPDQITEFLRSPFCRSPFLSFCLSLSFTLSLVVPLALEFFSYSFKRCFARSFLR